MPLAKRISIYVLRDPRDGAVRYVGQTVQPRERLLAHLADTRKGCQYRCHRWMRVLAAAGMEPMMEIIESVAVEQADDAEMRWIAQYRINGDDLTNHTAGGQGFRGHKPTKETIEKRAAALRGKPRSPEAITAVKAALNKPETKERLSRSAQGNKSRLGQKQSAEEKEKRARANRGKKRSPEFCEVMRRKALGVHHSEESKRKMSESKLRMISPDRRTEIARLGNRASQEARKCL